MRLQFAFERVRLWRSCTITCDTKSFFDEAESADPHTSLIGFFDVVHQGSTELKLVWGFRLPHMRISVRTT